MIFKSSNLLHNLQLKFIYIQNLFTFLTFSIAKVETSERRQINQSINSTPLLNVPGRKLSPVL